MRDPQVPELRVDEPVQQLPAAIPPPPIPVPTVSSRKCRAPGPRPRGARRERPRSRRCRRRRARRGAADSGHIGVGPARLRRRRDPAEPQSTGPKEPIPIASRARPLGRTRRPGRSSRRESSSGSSWARRSSGPVPTAHSSSCPGLDPAESSHVVSLRPWRHRHSNLRWGLSRPRGSTVASSRRGESDRAEVVAVASRNASRAEAYAREHGIERAYGSYEALLADPESRPSTSRCRTRCTSSGRCAHSRPASTCSARSRSRRIRRRSSRRSTCGGGRARALRGVHVAPSPADGQARGHWSPTAQSAPVRDSSGAFSFRARGRGTTCGSTPSSKEAR